MRMASRLCLTGHQNSIRIRSASSLMSTSLPTPMHRLPSSPSILNALRPGLRRWDSKDDGDDEVKRNPPPHRRPSPQRSDQSRPDVNSLHPKQLNSLISLSTTTSSLLHLCTQNKKTFDYIHAATAVTKAAKLMSKRSQSDVHDFLDIVKLEWSLSGA